VKTHLLRRSPTLQQIADRCDQSVSTVSHVLNAGRAHHFRPETVEKIRALAREMGYRRNEPARAMRLGRTDQIAIITPSIHSRGMLMTQLLDGITDAMVKSAPHLHLLLDESSEEQMNNEELAPAVIRNRVVDGLLVNHHKTLPPNFLTYIENIKMPAVFLNVNMETNSLFPDDFQSASDLTTDLLTGGRKRVAYVDLFSPKLETAHYSRLARLNGYKAAIREHGAREQLLVCQQGYGDARNLQFPHQEVLRLLKRRDRPHAAVCYNSQSLFVLMNAAARLGLQLPEQLLLATFDTEDLGKNGLPVTTSVLPFYEIGRRALEMLIGKILDKTGHVPSVRLAGKISDPTVLPLV
jgi:LacI family transcriptional regulator